MFCRKKKETQHYDETAVEPVIRASICTGEQVAGFRDLKTGHFTEVMLIRNNSDLDSFKKKYGIKNEIKKIY
ncbi:MAG: hypothetical protein IKS51_01740 [Erysipelotrichaceae bacterium]|nr:hypothetical protein [Erysipelotrichaceae bacterium]